MRKRPPERCRRSSLDFAGIHPHRRSSDEWVDVLVQDRGRCLRRRDDYDPGNAAVTGTCEGPGASHGVRTVSERPQSLQSSHRDPLSVSRSFGCGAYGVQHSWAGGACVGGRVRPGGLVGDVREAALRFDLGAVFSSLKKDLLLLSDSTIFPKRMFRLP